MSLTQGNRAEVDWSDWLGSRMFDISDTWKDLVDDGGIKVEEFRENGTLVVRAELPGIDPDSDVEITMTDHMLHMRAERHSKTESDDAKGYRSEFRYGSFARSLRLPAGATASDVKASYDDGILEVRIPVDDAEAAAKRIPIARTS